MEWDLDIMASDFKGKPKIEIQDSKIDCISRMNRWNCFLHAGINSCKLKGDRKHGQNYVWPV